MFKALLLLAALAWGQEKPVSIGDFSGGLNTWKKSIFLQENESPALQNVVLDKTGGVTKRQGYTKRNTSAIGSSTDVNAVYQLEQSGGTKYCVGFSNASAYYSSDACQTFTVFATTLTLNNDVNCDAINDRLYCVNNQYNFFFTGAEDRPFTAVAALDYIRVHRNRCFAAGFASSPSRLYWSNLGTCDTWTTGTDYVDISPEDGDVITGIGEPFFDMLPIYKKYSTWALKGSTPGTFVLVNISKDTGAKNHRSIATYKNIQLFDSLGPNGGRPGIYGFNGIIVDEVSKNLRNEIENLDTFRAATGRRLIDTKADYDTGTFSTDAMSSSRDSGFMQSSFTTMTDTLGVEWAAGTLVDVSTTLIPGSLVLDISSTATRSYEDFTDSDVTAAPVWSEVTSGCSWTVASYNGSNRAQYASPSGCSDALMTMTSASASTSTAGRWSIDVGVTENVSPANGLVVWEYQFIRGGTYTFGLQLKANGSVNQFTANLTKDGAVLGGVSSAFTLVNGTPATVAVIRTSTGSFQVLLDGAQITTAQDASPTSATSLKVGIDGCSGSNKCYFDNVTVPRFKTAGSVTSRVFDTSILSPVWGILNASISSVTHTTTQLTFETQASVDGSSFEALVSSGNQVEIGAASRRYVRYKATFSSNSSTMTPRLDSVTITAASTGTWTSPELFLSNNINAGGWGLFQAEETLTGLGAISHFARVATTVGGTSSKAWVVVSTGATFSAELSTGAYIQFKADFTVGVATETAALDSITINWAEGSAAKSSTGKVFENRYHYGAQSAGGSRNDVIYVYDTNGAWVKWTGVRPRHLNVVNQNFIMADSSTTSGGFVHKLYDSDSDNGGAIDAFYHTKDFSGSAIQNIKAVDKVYVISSSSATTLSLNIYANGGLSSKSYSVDLSTGAAIKVTPKVITPTVNGNTFSLRLGNNQPSKPWELLGIGIFSRDLGVMQAP